MTSRDEIKAWFERGLKTPNCTHMIVVCDTFDWDDYPVFVTADQDARKIAESYNGHNMQRVMEVYSMKIPIKDQMTGQVCNY